MQITRFAVERYRHTDVGGNSSEILIVRIHTDQALTGTGFVSASGIAGELYASVLRNILAPVLVGGDPRLTQSLWQKMYNTIPRRGGDGIVRLCMAAVDFALWDIKGKLFNAPVSALFGARRERIPTYANCAHHLPADQLAERAAEYVAKGHKALKIRGTRGFVTPNQATERVQCVREAVGPDVKLMVDVNGTWDVDTATDQLRRWQPYNVYWLEEPVPPHDIAGYLRVRNRAGDTYIAGGEQHVGMVEFRSLIEQGGVDIAQPNAAITGGITPWLSIHSFATAHNVPVSPWNLQNIHIHMAAGLPNIKWIEYFMADNALLEFQTRLFVGPKLREEVDDDGVYLLAPDTPGLGLVLDAAVAEETVVRE